LQCWAGVWLKASLTDISADVREAISSSSSSSVLCPLTKMTSRHYNSALESCSRRCAIQIHSLLYFIL